MSWWKKSCLATVLRVMTFRLTRSCPFFNDQIAQRTFDPEKAAEHYKKSGHSGPIKLSVADAAFSGAVDAGQLIAASAKKAGIEIELVKEPNDGYWSNVWNKKGWCACYWGRTSDPGLDVFFSLYQGQQLERYSLA